MMKTFKDKVAVITGAASGIGREIANCCAREGMKVVLADIEEEALTRATEKIKASGAAVTGVLTDVAKSSDIEALARKTLDTFGAVHLLCNNAGVASAAPSIWESTMADWEWSLGVNMWGVIHGIRVFVPIMLKQNTECHIVNTASMAGLMVPPGGGTYAVAKHATVVLSEILFHELAQRESRIGVSVLCPGFVSTRITDSERNRPDDLKNDPDQVKQSPEYEARIEKRRQAVQAGMSPDQVADDVFKAVRDDKFYILTHPEMTKPPVRTRMEAILQERNPSPPARSNG